MNIVDSIGVELGGDASAFDKMMDAASKKLVSFQDQMTNWSSGKMTQYISDPLKNFGKGAVKEYAALESAMLRLQVQLNGMNAKPFIEFAENIEKAFGKDKKETVDFMARLGQMGVKAEKLKSTVKNAMGLSAATGMGDFMSYRAIAMFKQGQTMLLNRRIPGLARMGRDEQEAKVQELINRGFDKMKVQLLGIEGAQKQFKLAWKENHEEIGKMIATALKLPHLFRRLTGFVEDLRKNIAELSPTTKKWTVYIGAAVAAIGPMLLMWNKMHNVFMSLIAAAVNFGKTLMMKVLPALLIIGAAFLGWEIGKALGQIQAGLLTINQWTELVIDDMTARWRTYFEFIKSGFTSNVTEEDLAAAYGMKMNKGKAAFAATPLGSAAHAAGLFSLFDPINETLSSKQSEYRRTLMEKDTAENIYGKDSGQAIVARVALSSLLKEMQQMFPGVKDVTAPLSGDLLNKEAAFNKARGDFTGFDKLGGKGYDIGMKLQETYDKAFERFATEPKGTTTFHEFFMNVMEGLTGDAKTAFEKSRDALEAVFNKWFPEFKAPNAGDEKDPNGLKLEQDGLSRRSFADALEFGTKEAYSVIYGNGNIQNKILDATERTADAAERNIEYQQEILDGQSSMGTSVWSGAVC